MFSYCITLPINVSMAWKSLFQTRLIIFLKGCWLTCPGETQQITKVSIACNQPYGQLKSQAKANYSVPLKYGSNPGWKLYQTKLQNGRTNQLVYTGGDFSSLNSRFFKSFSQKSLQKAALVVGSKGVSNFPEIAHLCFAVSQIRVCHLWQQAKSHIIPFSSAVVFSEQMLWAHIRFPWVKPSAYPFLGFLLFLELKYIFSRKCFSHQCR